MYHFAAAPSGVDVMTNITRKAMELLRSVPEGPRRAAVLNRAKCVRHASGLSAINGWHMAAAMREEGGR